MNRFPRVLRWRQRSPLFAQDRRIPPRRLQTRFAHHGPSEQIVRLKNPGFNTRRIATIGLYAGAVYAYFNLLRRHIDKGIELLDEEEDDQAEAEDGNDEDEDEDERGDGYADANNIFIPLTWAKKLPRAFYKGSDPEWQDFIRIAKDKERYKKIQMELAQTVYSSMAQLPELVKFLGKDTKIGRYWLDISFPYGPPQEYERSGIEISDTYIAWNKQKITPEHQQKVMRTLWPQAAFNSFWAMTSLLVGIQYRRVKQALGIEGRDPQSPEERFRHAVEMMQKQQQGGPQTHPTVAASSAASSTPTPSSRGTSGDDAKRVLPWPFQVPLPTSQGSPLSSDVPMAVHVFSSTLSKGWKPKQSEPPRGTFVVQGFVEVRGSQGRVLFDVIGCYDPKQNKYTQIKGAVRSHKKWTQSPRGGP